MGRITIPHDYQFRRLSWTIATWLPGNHPAFTCPNNHHSVMVNHTIEPDGTVNGSVRCPIEGCSFHEFVVLEGYGSQAEAG